MKKGRVGKMEEENKGKTKWRNKVTLEEIKKAELLQLEKVPGINKSLAKSMTNWSIVCIFLLGEVYAIILRKTIFTFILFFGKAFTRCNSDQGIFNDAAC